MSRKIILDCDPGHDDAMALLLAHASPAVDLLAVTTVAGNQTLPKVTLNARRVMTVAGIGGVPVAAGADRPLVREPIVAEEIHGQSGLDGPAFGEPTVPLDPRHAVDLIVETLMREEGVTLVPVGPLTNIALAMRREPRILPRIQEIVLMGGGYTKGNRTPVAEFNIYCDPEAADIVFRSGVPLTMVGLDLTHQAKATPAVIERIRAVGGAIGQLATELLTFFSASYAREFGLEGAPLHDPCAVAYVIDPGLFECRFVNVVVETRGTYTYGETVCDMHGKTGRAPNARVATRLQTDGFWDLMIEALRSYA